MQRPSAQQGIRFDDGAAYERTMGAWSRLAGEVFLEWLDLPKGLRWLDVGCGNGAFTELLVQRCAPAEVQGIDPSEGQLAFARTRCPRRLATFCLGDAMRLPYSNGSFDAAVMALVIVFVPDPAQGVAEMVRVVRPGGMVANYVWDMCGSGFPLEPILGEMRAMGVTPPRPPQTSASGLDVLRDIWRGAGLQAVKTRPIAVSRTFAGFDDYWMSALAGPTMRPVVALLAAPELERLKERVRIRLGARGGRPITIAAQANAIRGRVPKV